MSNIFDKFDFILTGKRVFPLGEMWLIASKAGLCQIDFGITKDAFLDKAGKKLALEGLIEQNPPHPALDQLEAYLAGNRYQFTIPVDWRWKTPFQVAVYRAVLEIPYGKTDSYKRIAARIGRPNAARAVGAANAANPLPIIIPCHRLVGVDGSLKGYGSGSGIKTKKWILRLEEKHAWSHL